MLIHSWSHHLKLYVHTTENINSKEVSIYFLFQVLPCFSVFFRWFYRPKKTKDCIIFVNIFFKSVLFFSPSRPGPVLDFGSLIISHSFLMDFPLLLSLRGCTSWFFNADMTIEVQFDSNVFPSSLVTQNAAIECIFLRMKVSFLFLPPPAVLSATRQTISRGPATFPLVYHPKRKNRYCGRLESTC